MDESLNVLENCERLSLSTNDIDRIAPLPRLKNLKILSLARNRIRRLGGLDEIGNTLEQLWLSYNLIDKCDNLNPCHQLTILYMACNKIKTLDEVGKLAALPKLQKLILASNPLQCYAGERLDAAPYICRRVP